MGDQPFLGNSKGIMYVNLGIPVLIEDGAHNFIIANEYGNVTNNWKLYVPKGSKAAYMTTYPWNRFENFVECNYVEVENQIIEAGNSITMQMDMNNFYILNSSYKFGFLDHSQ